MNGPLVRQKTYKGKKMTTSEQQTSVAGLQVVSEQTIHQALHIDLKMPSPSGGM
jgi:hypothetical protein